MRRKKERKGRTVETADIKVFACPTNRQKQPDDDSDGSASMDEDDLKEAACISINEEQSLWEPVLRTAKVKNILIDSPCPISLGNWQRKRI